MKKANTKIIGVFVSAGALLAVFAAVIFSNPDFFAKKRYFVAYFEQSVIGLNIGAPIRFRGVTVGEVLKIEGIFYPETSTIRPRLILEFTPETIINVVFEEGNYTEYNRLVDRGMRASLKSGSLLTGQLYVSLDFHPDTEVRLLGNEDDPYPEMPTLDSVGFDKLIGKLEKLPLDVVLNQLVATLQAAEDLVSNPALAAALENLPGLVSHLDTFVVEDLTNTINQFEATLATGETSLAQLSSQLSTESLPQLRVTLRELENTLIVMKNRLDEDEPLNRELLIMLRQLTATAKSIEILTDYLEQHPEALLKGK